MNNISDSTLTQISECIREQKEIPNPLIFQLTEVLLRVIRNKEDVQLTQVLADLIDETDAFWRQVDKTGLSGEFVFNVGRIFTLTTMIKKYYESVSSYYSPIELADKYKNRYQLFKNISNNPGITHHDLANKIDLSESRLSQLMVSLHSDGLVSSRKIGRNKYYYLSHLGETVLETIGANQRALLARWTISVSNRIFKEPESQSLCPKWISFSGISNSSSGINKDPSILWISEPDEPISKKPSIHEADLVNATV